MTASSIPASGGDYAGYLHGRTLAPEQGDYYLGRDGLPAEAPGRWIGQADALARVGLAPGQVQPDDLRALMAGQRPGRPEEFLRSAGPDGTRAGGIDVTFSAPKSVSVAWAMGDATVRAAIEQAHHAAVERGVRHLGETVELTARWDPALGRSVPARAAHLHAAAFLHTTARGVADEAPDPQLHSHVVITSVEREDGRGRRRPLAAGDARRARGRARCTAPRSRTSCASRATSSSRPARTAATSASAGVRPEVEQAFSKRTAEVQQAARAFRAEHGRAPERGRAARARRADAFGEGAADPARARRELADDRRRERPRARRRRRVRAPRPATLPVGEAWAVAVERETTADRAVFDPGMLRTVALEQAAGHGLDPDAALAGADRLRDDGRVLELADGRLTTARVREAEQAISASLAAMAADPGRVIDADARAAGIAAVEARIGGGADRPSSGRRSRPSPPPAALRS